MLRSSRHSQLRLVTAIKTPYLPDGRIDLFCYDSLVEQQIAAGVEGLIVGGTTGEGHLMSWDEHIMLIAHTANRCARGCNCTWLPIGCKAHACHVSRAQLWLAHRRDRQHGAHGSAVRAAWRARC